MLSPLFCPQVEPYQTDNARLVQENTKLHQQLLRLKENAESRMRDIKTVLRKLEHENADLKFLNTQYVQKMRVLEKQSQAKSEKLLALHQKSCEAVIRTPGGKKKQVPLRRQRMEMDSVLQPTTEHKVYSNSQPGHTCIDRHTFLLLFRLIGALGPNICLTQIPMWLIFCKYNYTWKSCVAID